ncbi:MAG: hypothetical protein AAFR17_14380 [Pseudomonadota bacterium]
MAGEEVVAFVRSLWMDLEQPAWASLSLLVPSLLLGWLAGAPLLALAAIGPRGRFSDQMLGIGRLILAVPVPALAAAAFVMGPPSGLGLEQVHVPGLPPVFQILVLAIALMPVLLLGQIGRLRAGSPWPSGHLERAATRPGLLLVPLVVVEVVFETGGLGAHAVSAAASGKAVPALAAVASLAAMALAIWALLPLAPSATDGGNGR